MLLLRRRAAGSTAHTGGERRDRLRREEVMVWMDLMVMIACTNLKYGKAGKKKAFEKYIEFPANHCWHSKVQALFGSSRSRF